MRPRNRRRYYFELHLLWRIAAVAFDFFHCEVVATSVLWKQGMHMKMINDLVPYLAIPFYIPVTLYLTLKDIGLNAVCECLIFDVAWYSLCSLTLDILYRKDFTRTLYRS